MLKKNNFLIALAVMLFLSFGIFGCSDDDPVGPEEPTGPPPPTFTMSSRLQGGQLEFLARPSVTVRIQEIHVTNPINYTYPIINFDGQQVTTDQMVIIRGGFERMSGQWRFRFIGNQMPGQEAFDISTSLSVTLKQKP